MLWGRYRFHCTFREEAHLPAFKGLIFRNAFPRAVKRTVCAVGQKDCTDCFLARRCLYPLIRPPEHTLGGPTPHLPPPPPFIVEPPETRASFFTPETPLVFDLLLLGPANEAIGIYVRALEEMGRMGVGEKVGTRRGRFQIDHITVGERQYSPLTIGQCEPEEVCINLKKRLTASLTVAPPTPPEEVTVTLATPLLLPPAKEATVALPFVLLFRAAFTRIINLCRAYGNGAPKMDERRLMAQAHRIVTTSDGLHRLRARDLASPERSFLRGALTGTITYRGALGPFIPLLQCAAAVHIGLHTPWGLGKVVLEGREDLTAGVHAVMGMGIGKETPAVQQKKRIS